jgi:5-formyltetrahydrofolate cyclo-ligase
MTQQSKRELRKEMKVVLANLDTRWLLKAHAEVCGQLTELMSVLRRSSASSRHVLAWIPCFPGEVDLAGCIGAMLHDSVVYHPYLSESGVMSFVRIFDDWGARLVAGPRGIIQPHYEDPEVFAFPPIDDDVFVFVPGLAFDHSGARLGRGAGHYDRFLSQPELSRAVKIGVGWSMQVVQNIPVDPHDIDMDWVCHERGVLQVKAGRS